MKALSCIMALLCLYMSTNGQAYLHYKKLQGTVVSATGTPVTGVRLHLVRSGVSDSTNNRGEFSLVYRLRYDTMVVSHPDYRTRRLLIRSRTNRVWVKLEPGPAAQTPAPTRH